MSPVAVFPEVETLDDLVQALHVTFSSDRVNVDYVHALMNSYKSNPIDWMKFSKFDPFRYTRNLVDEGNGKFNLMILCWGEGHGSCIHDHADAHCFMKMLKGELMEMRFPWPSDSDADNELQPVAENRLKLNDVCYINDSLGLHRVENRSHSETAVSLHLYCPPFNSCYMFDQRTGHRTRCPVTFWSKYGEKTDMNSCKATMILPAKN